MNNRQKLVVVLGMHRSGTSVVARGLMVLGVSLGNSLLPSQHDNIKGFWEDSDIKILNQDMLRHLGRDWHSLSLMPEPELLIEQLVPFYWRAADLLASKMGTLDTFGFKDPRTCLLLPFWRHVFSQSHLDVKYIVVTRHPLSIARSLAARNHFKPEKSLYLWLAHMLSAIPEILDHAAVVVDYDRLIVQPEFELTRIAECLDLEGVETAPLKVYANEYLEAGLRHTCYQFEDMGPADMVSEDVVFAHKIFSRLATGEWPLDGAETREALFRLKTGLSARRDLLAYLDQCELQLSTHEHRVSEFE
ncbi:MAG: hypothetical protein KDI44_04465, partial [Thiothrix sp.]|nr:hypothetical protein [Thiothrix sp.]